MNLVEYFEKALRRHSGESLPNFSSFVTCVETKKLFKYFEKTLVAIKVKAFQFSFLLWPVWKQINLVEYFEKALGRHSGESLPNLCSFLACVTAVTKGLLTLMAMFNHQTVVREAILCQIGCFQG